MNISEPRRQSQAERVLDALGNQGYQEKDYQIGPPSKTAGLRVGQSHHDLTTGIEWFWTGRHWHPKVEPRQLLVFDNFQRTETVPGFLGTPLIGPAWTMIGIGGVIPASDGYISGGKYRTVNVGNAGINYACQILPGRPSRMETWVMFTPSTGTGNQGTLAMAMSTGKDPTWIYNLFHCRITRTHAYFDTFTSGVYANIVNVALSPLPMGIPVHCRVELDAAANKAALWLNGALVLEDSDLGYAPVSGQYVFWEHYYDNPDSQVRLDILAVAATA